MAALRTRGPDLKHINNRISRPSVDMTNLLFIFTDEQRADTLEAYGNRRIQMPNLNRLASEAVVFEKAYVTQPVCSPSRSSIITGLYPHTTGCRANNIPLRPDTLCLPEMLPPDKYATAYHGKWHLGDEIFPQHGFREWRSIEDGYRKYYRAGRDTQAVSTYHQFLVQNGFTPSEGKYFSRGECARLPEPFGKPAYLTREASRFIHEHSDQPFVLYVNFLEPHMPFFGPRDNQHSPDEVSLPPNFNAVPTEDQPLKARLFQQYYYELGHGGFPLRTEADWRRLIANYWGLCSLVDTHAATILDALKQCGVYDETIIVFTSDHGDMMGSHRLLAKGVMFEEAARVPLIIRLPGQKEHASIAPPVGQIDLVPTLLDLLGEPIPPYLEGRSLRPVLDGKELPKDDVIMEWNGSDTGVSRLDSRLNPALVGKASRAVADPVRTIVTPEGWKFNWTGLGENELYDLNTDPYETRNLAGKPELRPLIFGLADRIRAWQARTGDRVGLSSLT